MPRDGSGGYSRYTPGTPYSNGTTISSTVVNGEMDDLGNEIANSLSKDGQTTPTANLPMGSYRHTGVGDALARTQYPSYGQVQDGSPWYAAAGGTADTLTLSLAIAPAAYVAGQEFRFKATATNTGAATLNVNSLGAKSIKRDGSSTLAAGDITNGQMYSVRYDGTNFQLLNASTFVTQALTDSSTLPATTAFVQTLTATDTRKGITEQATAAEYITGTDTDRHLTVKVARDNAIVIGTAQATTSGTTKDFTGIPAWAHRVTVLFNGVSTNGASNYIMQIGSGSLSASGYKGSSVTARSSATSSGTAQTNSTYFNLIAETAAAETISGAIVLHHLGSNTWILNGTLATDDAARGSVVGGSVTLSGALDRLRITTASGDTFDAGSLNILYE